MSLWSYLLYPWVGFLEDFDPPLHSEHEISDRAGTEAETEISLVEELIKTMDENIQSYQCNQSNQSNVGTKHNYDQGDHQEEDNFETAVAKVLPLYLCYPCLSNCFPPEEFYPQVPRSEFENLRIYFCDNLVFDYCLTSKLVFNLANNTVQLKISRLINQIPQVSFMSLCASNLMKEITRVNQDVCYIALASTMAFYHQPGHRRRKIGAELLLIGDLIPDSIFEQYDLSPLFTILKTRMKSRVKMALALVMSPELKVIPEIKRSEFYDPRITDVEQYPIKNRLLSIFSFNDRASFDRVVALPLFQILLLLS